MVTLDSGNFPTNAQTGGADIRFTDVSGTNELSYWIESWDYAGKNAKVWVKVPSIPAGATVIRMYYGNPSAESWSNGDATFEFFDDFSADLGKWVIGPTGATIENGAMKLSTLMSPDVTPIYTKAIISLSDYIVDVNAKAISGHYRIQVYQRYLPSNNNLARFWGGVGGDIGYQEYINGWGTYHILGPSNFINDAWNKIKIEVIGNNNKYSANGLDVGSYSPTSPSVIDGSQNRIGLGEWYTTVYYDDVRVRKYASPEPSVSVGAETPIAQPITHVSTTWQDETDKMIVPYDQVKLKFTFKNNLGTTLHNVRLLLKSNTNLISFDKESTYIGDVAPGGEFSNIEPVSIKTTGTENTDILSKIIDPSGMGKIPLTNSIDVTVVYDSSTKDFTLTPMDDSGNTLNIQYPDYYTNPYLKDADEDINYYLQGDDDFSHGECIDRNGDGICDSTPNVLVRKYAVEAAAYFGTFPDNPKDVSFNVFRYVDDKLDKDKDPAYANNDNWIVGQFDNKQDLSNIGWICIPQAYLFTSFERAIGFPSREITVGEGTHKAESEKPKIIYYQNGGAEVWYNGNWNYYDPWTSQSKLKGVYINDNILNLNDILDKTPIIQYKAWYAFDKQSSKTFKDLDYKGHNFVICGEDKPLPCPYGAGVPLLSNKNQWKFRDGGPKSAKSNVMIAGSPIKMLVKDNQGRMVGSTDTENVNEIPDAKYMSPGQIGYSDTGYPSTAFELDEFISIPDGLNGKYELIVTGTGDGEYTLQFAKFDPSSENEYSGVTTFTDTIKKDEIRRYDVDIDDSGIKFSYRFAGFFQPVENLPSWNSVNAGRAVPTKFSLSGYQGLDIFASGYPASQMIDCASNVPIDVVDETVTAGSSSLSYNATTDQYNYVWKTDKGWAGSCRQLAVQLKDGTYHNVSFKFLK